MSQSPSSRSLPLPLVGLGVIAGIALAAMKGRSQEVGRSKSDDGSTNANDGNRSGKTTATKQGHVGDSDRGRNAKSPAQIPTRGWKDILLRTYEQIGKDRLVAVAAGVTFFSLLAIFPAITALVSSYGLFFDVATIGDHLSLLSGFMPESAFGIVQDQVSRIVGKGAGGLSFGFIFGLGAALWSANAGMKSVFDALNVIYDEDEKRGFFKLNIVSLAFTLGAIAMMLLAVGAIVVFPIVLAKFGIGEINPVIASVLRWPILFIAIMFALALIYRYGPSRREAEWKWVSVGSLVSTILWLGASAAFSLYLSNFTDYNATYGSLGAIIGLMTWMWISACVVLIGGELNAEIEHQTAHDSTEGGNKPLGGRGAAMADTVGEAKSS